MFQIKTIIMKQITTLLTLATLFVAGRAMHAQAPAAMGADVPELMKLLEQRKAHPDIIWIEMYNKKLQGAQLTNLDLSHISFNGSDLSKANVSDSKLLHSRLNETNLTDANFTGSDLTDAWLDGANITNTNFSGANLTNVGFHQSRGFNSTLLNDKTILSYAGITDEELGYARSKGVLKIRGKDISRLMDVLKNENMQKSPINMPNADLKEIQMHRSDYFKNADLRGSDLSGANLLVCDFSNSNLAGVNFTDAYLGGVNFSSANVNDANFSGANLVEVNFTNCRGFNTAIINDRTILYGAIGLTPEQKAYARLKGAQNVPN